jgi:hypothetical protein
LIAAGALTLAALATASGVAGMNGVPPGGGRAASFER